MPQPDVLEDLLRPNLRVVFCGTAASTTSARQSAYYAHKQNKFWKILHETGLTATLLEPAQFRLLLDQRIGLTDLVKTHFGMDSQIPLASQRAQGRERLRRSIERHAPRILAFTSKQAGQTFLGGTRPFGEQTEAIGRTKIWILPSTSGAANGSWQPRIWHDLADRVRISPD